MRKIEEISPLEFSGLLRYNPSHVGSILLSKRNTHDEGKPQGYALAGVFCRVSRGD